MLTVHQKVSLTDSADGEVGGPQCEAAVVGSEADILAGITELNMPQRQLDEVVVRAADDGVTDVHHAVLVAVQLPGVGDVPQSRHSVRVEQLQPLPATRRDNDLTGLRQRSTDRKTGEEGVSDGAGRGTTTYDNGQDIIYTDKNTAYDLKKSGKHVLADHQILDRRYVGMDSCFSDDFAITSGEFYLLFCLPTAWSPKCWVWNVRAPAITRLTQTCRLSVLLSSAVRSDMHSSGRNL